MKDLCRSLILACLFVLSSVCVYADTAETSPPKPANGHSGPAVVVVRSAAKGTWALTKFSAKHVVKPVGKALILRVAPSTGKFLLKTAAKKVMPLIATASIL